MLALLDRPRLPFALLFLTCASLLGFGLYLQHTEGVEPCPMCIIQRYAFVGVGLVGLLGALLGPRGAARRVYAVALALLALGGGGIALCQSWLQRFPPAVSECGPDLEYMLDSFPLADALPMIFRGAGDCSIIDWTFLGLTIANWSLLAFALILAASLTALSRGAPR
jgi:disulfide bond formation protein DsbB